MTLSRAWVLLRRARSRLALLPVAAIIAGLVAGCGGVGSAPNIVITPSSGTSTPQAAAAPGTAQPSPGPIVLTSPGRVQLTVSDSGRRVLAPDGSTIEVVLTQGTPGYAWLSAIT